MATQSSSHVTWTVGQLVHATQELSGQASGQRVEIPRFQRSLVWGDEQRRDLIDSIHKGYPIGSLLLFKRANPSGGQELFQVVDGLQRTSTLVEYAKRPLAYAPDSLFPSAVLDSVATALKKDVTHVRRVLKDWMVQTGELTSKAGFKANKLAHRLVEDLEVGADQSLLEDLESLLDDGLDGLRDDVDIKSVAVPIVTYAGDESELPEIFERINQRGTKLNKYEVFAATWINSETQVNSEEVRVAVNNKYDALLAEGFSISGLEQDKKIQDFNLFEYLFGFGKVLVKTQPLLFGEAGNPAETEPAAFSLSCLSLGRQLSAMNKLPSFMPRTSDALINPTKMEEALLAAADAVSGWLAPFTALRLNSQGSGADLAHGELQIVSMVARAAAGRWNTTGDWSERADWQKDWAALERALPQHYLMDLVEETWRGPIYSLAFNRVWQTSDEAPQAVTGPHPHYTREIDHSTWENALNAWLDKQLDREQKSRAYVRSLDRVFLRYVYTGLVSHMDDKKVSFELEHLFPVSRLRNEIPADSNGWPISCVANLALFTKALNREKSQQTISEYLAKNSMAPKDEKRLREYLLCDPSDVSIPSSGLAKPEYTNFLQERWETMKGQLYSNLGVSTGA